MTLSHAVQIVSVRENLKFFWILTPHSLFFSEMLMKIFVTQVSLILSNDTVSVQLSLGLVFLKRSMPLPVCVLCFVS